MTRLFKLVNVSGSDAVEFLQGQVTQDLRKLDGSPALPAAWCSPQGRVISTMRLLAAEQSLGLVVPASNATTIVQRLTLYRLRASVEFAIAGDEWQAFAVSDQSGLASLAETGLLPEARRNAWRHARGLVTVETGARPRTVEVYGDTTAFQETGLDLTGALSDSEWQRALISAGIPTIGDDVSEKYTPHMLNLDRLDAVSFDKGCYTGQEVVARTQHLGRSRRRLMHYRTATAVAAVGDKLTDGEREVGDVVNAASNELLAVVPVALHATELVIAGEPATPVALPYDVPR